MQNFESKRKLLFDCLNDAEKDLKGTRLDQSLKRTSSIEDLNKSTTDDDDVDHSVQSRKVQKFQYRESIFKKPELPITKCLKPKVVPDYQINPHKWKRYSLSDVDISDRTNTAAAFTFLKEIEIQKEQETPDSDINQSNVKPVFNKSAGVKKNIKTSDNNEEEHDEVDRPKLKGSRLVMPEYSFGKKSSKEKRRSSSSSSKSKDVDDVSSPKKSAKQLRLSHLEDDDNEEEDNDDMDDY